VRGYGTSVNIVKLLERMKELKKGKKHCLLFVDYKSAYNTIDREKLYEILRTRNIMKEEEKQFIKAMHSQVHYSLQGETHWFKNGVM
jgi:hypothetical protein